MLSGKGTCTRCNQIPIHEGDLCAICLSWRQGWNDALSEARQQIRANYSRTTPTLGVQRALRVLDELAQP